MVIGVFVKNGIKNSKKLDKILEFGAICSIVAPYEVVKNRVVLSHTVISSSPNPHPCTFIRQISYTNRCEFGYNAGFFRAGI